MGKWLQEAPEGRMGRAGISSPKDHRKLGNRPHVTHNKSSNTSSPPPPKVKLKYANLTKRGGGQRRERETLFFKTQSTKIPKKEESLWGSSQVHPGSIEVQ